MFRLKIHYRSCIRLIRNGVSYSRVAAVGNGFPAVSYTRKLYGFRSSQAVAYKLRSSCAFFLDSCYYSLHTLVLETWLLATLGVGCRNVHKLETSSYILSDFEELLSDSVSGIGRICMEHGMTQNMVHDKVSSLQGRVSEYYKFIHRVFNSEKIRVSRFRSKYPSKSTFHNQKHGYTIYISPRKLYYHEYCYICLHAKV